MESQVRSLELQLKQSRSDATSANTSRADISVTGLTTSQYSSSSSSNAQGNLSSSNYVSGSQPSYGTTTTSTYQTSATGLQGSGANYGTTLTGSKTGTTTYGANNLTGSRTGTTYGQGQVYGSGASYGASSGTPSTQQTGTYQRTTQQSGNSNTSTYQRKYWMISLNLCFISTSHSILIKKILWFYSQLLDISFWILSMIDNFIINQ